MVDFLPYVGKSLRLAKAKLKKNYHLVASKNNERFSVARRKKIKNIRSNSIL